jgi:hypothetical protein
MMSEDQRAALLDLLGAAQTLAKGDRFAAYLIGMAELELSGQIQEAPNEPGSSTRAAMSIIRHGDD